MKTYNKPNTQVQKIELMQMIAGSINIDGDSGTGTVNEKAGDGTVLGKEGLIDNSTSIWGDEEE